jgi:hypothetical protein
VLHRRHHRRGARGVVLGMLLLRSADDKHPKGFANDPSGFGGTILVKA